jgi:DNA-binding CsgD family transcriptional regulator
MSHRTVDDAVQPWFDRLGAAAWLSGPDGRLTYMNSRAERLLGLPAAACLGLPCHEVITATDPWGRPICAPSCELRLQAAGNQVLEPRRMCILDAHRVEHWLRVLLIQLSPADATCRLLHCALDDSQTRRMEEYLERLATRAHGNRGAAADHPRLTIREREILQRLDEAQTLREIASRLGLSYTTVRNHVQHILAKLEAHSIQEAVARDLLGR